MKLMSNELVMNFRGGWSWHCLADNPPGLPGIELRVSPEGSPFMIGAQPSVVYCAYEAGDGGRQANWIFSNNTAFALLNAAGRRAWF